MADPAKQDKKIVQLRRQRDEEQELKRQAEAKIKLLRQRVEGILDNIGDLLQDVAYHTDRDTFKEE